MLIHGCTGVDVWNDVQEVVSNHLPHSVGTYMSCDNRVCFDCISEFLELFVIVASYIYLERVMKCQRIN